MTRNQMIQRINEIVSEYLGFRTTLYGINSHRSERLAARLEAYEMMLSLHRTYVLLMEEIPQRMIPGLSLGLEHSWTAQYWDAREYRKEALDIWHQNF